MKVLMCEHGSSHTAEGPCAVCECVALKEQLEEVKGTLDARTIILEASQRELLEGREQIDNLTRAGEDTAYACLAEAEQKLIKAALRVYRVSRQKGDRKSSEWEEMAPSIWNLEKAAQALLKEMELRK